MKYLFTKILPCILVSILLIPSVAFAKDESSLTVTTIEYDGHFIEVPVSFTDVQNARTLATENELNIYVPATKADLEYNREITTQIKRRLVTSDQFLDPNRYITFTSSINYSTDSYNGNTRIDISSFTITKNKKPDSSYLVGIGTPSATAYQIGYYGPGGHPETLHQQKDYSHVNYGSAQSTPSSWLPVLRSDEGFVKGVDYTIRLIYMNSSGSTNTVMVNISHHI